MIFLAEETIYKLNLEKMIQVFEHMQYVNFIAVHEYSVEPVRSTGVLVNGKSRDIFLLPMECSRSCWC